MRLRIDDSQAPNMVHYMFHCPGCGFGHRFTVRTDGGHPAWKFNGDFDKPTFEPSLLYPHRNFPPPDELHVAQKCCHLFLREGVIEFLGDCEHALAGTKYPLPMIEDTPAGVAPEEDKPLVLVVEKPQANVLFTNVQDAGPPQAEPKIPPHRWGI